MKLLTSPVGNPKVAKGLSSNYATYILHLAPADVSGYNTCPKATAGCKAACLNTAGRGGMFKRGENTNTIQQARIRKTKLFFEDRVQFMQLLVADIELAIKQAVKKGFTPVFRLNGTSDIAWEKYPVIRNGVSFMNIFHAFSDCIFYDYTAILGRKVSSISNYQLTFSRKESNDMDCRVAASKGMNVAVVFSTKKGNSFPETFYGRPVFNGDNSDLRFLDPKGVVVGLYQKGKAKKDTSGFVFQV